MQNKREGIADLPPHLLEQLIAQHRSHPVIADGLIALQQTGTNNKTPKPFQVGMTRMHNNNGDAIHDQQELLALLMAQQQQQQRMNSMNMLANPGADAMHSSSSFEADHLRLMQQLELVQQQQQQQQRQNAVYDASSGSFDISNIQNNKALIRNLSSVNGANLSAEEKMFLSSSLPQARQERIGNQHSSMAAISNDREAAQQLLQAQLLSNQERYSQLDPASRLLSLQNDRISQQTFNDGNLLGSAIENRNSLMRKRQTLSGDLNEGIHAKARLDTSDISDRQPQIQNYSDAAQIQNNSVSYGYQQRQSQRDPASQRVSLQKQSSSQQTGETRTAGIETRNHGGGKRHAKTIDLAHDAHAKSNVEDDTSSECSDCEQKVQNSSNFRGSKSARIQHDSIESGAQLDTESASRGCFRKDNTSVISPREEGKDSSPLMIRKEDRRSKNKRKNDRIDEMVALINSDETFKVQLKRWVDLLLSRPQAIDCKETLTEWLKYVLLVSEGMHSLISKSTSELRNAINDNDDSDDMSNDSVERGSPMEEVETKPRMNISSHHRKVR